MTASRLLVIGYVWPEPNSSAAGSRLLELIQLFLARDWQVTFASAAALSEHRFPLQTLGVTEKAISLNNSSFDLFLQELQPNAVLFDRFFTEEQFGWRVEKNCSQALRLLDTEDLHSLRHARHQLLKGVKKKETSEAARQSVNPMLATREQLYGAMVDDEMAQREIAAIYRCDLSIMISEYEINLLHHYFGVPLALLFYCPFLTTKSVERGDLPAFGEREHFVTIGNFRHEPNWDAVLYLKHGIWPLIRKKLPAAQLHIYGSYPPPKAYQLHNEAEGFLIKGWAEDAMAVMRRARICIAPLRFGAGIKGKLMDAVRCGTPSVTTAIGAEAMTGGLPWCGAIENTMDDIARSSVHLYQDEAQWNLVQARGFTILRDYFSRENYAENLMKRIQHLTVALNEERRLNFTGAMLRHHFHKSTQYMSQWIEAKNKS